MGLRLSLKPLLIHSYFNNILNNTAMNSPFYEAEQKHLYPHRILVTGGAMQIAEHMRQLISKNVETLDSLRATSLRNLLYKYYINGSTWDVIQAIMILINKPE